MKLKISKVIYNFFVVVLYFVFGILLLLKYLAWQEVPDLRMAAFGAIVLAYGIFRGVRAYLEYKQTNGKEGHHE
ncbi:MAG: hypothetical protein JNK09_20880 [Prolixibacteraceae bacterium]|nr:hypothetical protein [Prolixibacteraceae bacterium]